MGTSEAVGYVNAESNLLGWFSELAFAPVDLNENAMRDEWSGDIGVGCKYFSQDAVSKLAPAAGIALSETLTPAEKLKEVQKLAEQGLPYALEIFKSIGVYLGHTMCLYERFYDIRNLIVLGPRGIRRRRRFDRRRVPAGAEGGISRLGAEDPRYAAG